MNYFVIRVAPRQEEKFLKLTKPLIEGREEEFIFLRKKLMQFKAGKKIEVESPLFPGYIFFQTENFDPDFYWKLRSIAGFHGFVKSENKIQSLTDHDKEVLSHFLNFGEVAQKSQVVFNENHRIQVLSGPMQGLEGRIVKVDRRKQRARILLDFQETAFYVDLGFEVLTPAADKTGPGLSPTPQQKEVPHE